MGQRSQKFGIGYAASATSYGDDRNFYKVEAWSRDGNRTDALLYTGNNLRKPQEDLCYYSSLDNKRGASPLTPAEQSA